MTVTKSVLENAIVKYIGAYRERKGCIHSWDTPLVGIASAEDRLFRKLPAVAGDHLHPKELLAGAKSVVVVYLPFVRAEVDADSEDRQLDSWGSYYYETNMLLEAVCSHLCTLIGTYGQRCRPMPPTLDFDRKKLMSRWSHRHVAYIAGMGTFGLNRMLITEKGCCGRMASVITTAKIPRTLRTNRENCAYFRTGGCRVCVKNCEAGALSEKGFDRRLCWSVLNKNDEKLAGAGKKLVCGQCVRNTPCMFSPV